MTVMIPGAYIRFVDSSGLSEVHHQFEDSVSSVALQHTHHMVQQLVGGVHLVPSAKENGNMLAPP